MGRGAPEEKLDPRVKRTRQLLEHAFLEVAAEKGFQAVSVQDITTYTMSTMATMVVNTVANTREAMRTTCLIT